MEKEEDKLDMERNPLKLPEILNTIFGNISNLDDMRNVRGVSNQWRESILKKWRDSATLQITLGLVNKFYEEENQIFLNKGLFDPEEGQYIKMRLTENPFKNYRVPFFHTSFPPAPERFQERFFWNKIGPHMKILNLEQCIFSDNLPLEGLEWILLKQCKNLEELRMKPYKCSKTSLEKLEEEDLFLERGGREEADALQDNVLSLINENLKSLSISCLKSDSGVEEDFAELFKEESESHLSQQFFRMIPNLKSLSVKVSQSLTEILEGLYNSNHASQLETLNVDGSTSKHQVFVPLCRYIEFATPPLKVLKIRSNYSLRLERGITWNVLQHVANTLTVLEITLDLYSLDVLRYCKHDFGAVNFPRLERLILRYNLANHQKQTSSIAFPSLKFMPRLKEFRLECTGPAKFKGFLCNPDNIKMEDLRQAAGIGLQVIPLQFGALEEFHFCGRFTQAGLHHLGQCAPNLKKFGAICEIETVQAAVTAFDQLNEMQLHPGSCVWDKDLQTLRETYPAIKFVKLTSF